MAGGLAQHIAFGFRSAVDLKHDELQAFADNALEQWEESLALFSTPSSLNADRAPLTKKL
jgi:hypothetical protein